MIRILLTGADGFIGKNLQLYFQENDEFEIVPLVKGDNLDELPKQIHEIDWVIHLAGINRPKNDEEFFSGNAEFTKKLCEITKEAGKHIPIIFTSSIQAKFDNSYGKSKRLAEEALIIFQRETGNPVHIFRLPNVFGKWARPNYNSVVATFCYNIARGMPIQIHDEDAPLSLVYIDDVINRIISLILKDTNAPLFIETTPEYQTTVGALADQICSFTKTRENLVTDPVGEGFLRALYATYVSYLPTENFTYSIPHYADERGVFVEMLKTKDAGQFSYFTARPGITRGGHYHHTKTEKFLVIKGKASFRFRHMVTGEFFECHTSEEKPEIVETIPGWAHDITNIGDDELICMLWANEIFDRKKPDTIVSPIIVD